MKAYQPLIGLIGLAVSACSAPSTNIDLDNLVEKEKTHTINLDRIKSEMNWQPFVWSDNGPLPIKDSYGGIELLSDESRRNEILRDFNYIVRDPEIDFDLQDPIFKIIEDDGNFF